MNLEFEHLLPEGFSPESRVWVYQSSRLLTMGEALELEPQMNDFAEEWASHGDDVKAFVTLLFGQFLILIADESNVKVSGCSTDSSVRFVKQVGERLGVDFFDRTSLAFVVKDKIQTIPMNQLNYALEHGFIKPETKFFNNVVLNLKALKEDWIIPVNKSWLARKLKLDQAS